ncbi:MAG: hypothetical protein OEX22_01880 [Cyclobacteriaceae bacterium]|nr:hypothetical protein [Cyclobacteriaceae bacterium]
MLVEGIKISWRHFKNEYIHNLTILLLMVISNALLFTSFMIENNFKISFLFTVFSVIGYGLIVILSTFTIKYREKEFAIRNLLGATFGQTYLLLTIEASIYLVISSLFSLIIVERAYEFHHAISPLNNWLIVKFMVIILLISLFISLIPSMRLHAISPLQKLFPDRKNNKHVG